MSGAHPPEYRVVAEAHYVYCQSGHLIDAIPTGHEILQLRHRCGRWTLAPPDGRFCQGCGARLHPELGPRPSTPDPEETT